LYLVAHREAVLRPRLSQLCRSLPQLDSLAVVLGHFPPWSATRDTQAVSHILITAGLTGPHKLRGYTRTVVEGVALFAQQLGFLLLAHHHFLEPVVLDLAQEGLSLLLLRRQLRARHRRVAQEVQYDLKVLRIPVLVTHTQVEESVRRGDKQLIDESERTGR
jgi:hypothetical protein